jgi:hypothetical protein
MSTRTSPITMSVEAKTARRRVIEARLKELAAIAKRHSLFSPEGLARWNAASRVSQGGQRKR